MAKNIREKALRRAENKDKRPYATAKYVRISPSKVNLVLSTIRGKQVDEALAILKYLPNGASEEVYKVVKSAAANAENNMGMNRDELIVSEAYANAGPILKRILPRGRGSMDVISKRTCHITVKLSTQGGAK